MKNFFKYIKNFFNPPRVHEKVFPYVPSGMINPVTDEAPLTKTNAYHKNFGSLRHKVGKLKGWQKENKKCTFNKNK